MSRERGDRDLEEPAGEIQFARDLYNQMKFHLAEGGPNPIEVVVVLRAYHDGIGFRYEMPNQDHEADYTNMNTWTEFNQSGDH